MERRPEENLPHFERPPIVEAILSVQFRPLEGFRAAHFGVLWNQIRESYPYTEDRAPLDRVVERPVAAEPAVPRLQVQALETPPLQRVWFLGPERDELIQVQSDRFIQNWRKAPGGGDYPRYERLRKSFQERLSLFKDFARKEQLGEVLIDQCEITYVNHILAGEGWSRYRDIDRVFVVWKQAANEFPGSMEDLSFHARYPIEDEAGRLIGRLHVALRPALRRGDNKEMFVLTLTARGLTEDAMSFFDIGRERIVHSFVAITTEEMHKIWRRRS